MRFSYWSSGVCSSVLADAVDDFIEQWAKAGEAWIADRSINDTDPGAEREQACRTRPVGAVFDEVEGAKNILQPIERTRELEFLAKLILVDDVACKGREPAGDRKSTRLNSSH